MKKLFYLLLALPLVFAACEPDTPEQKVEKEAVLTLTSEATLSFGAEGGEGVITFTAELKDVTRNSPVPEPVVEAACEADWVTDLTVDENITFTVLANEGDARETKVVVSYDDKSFEVVVKQAAKGEAPAPVLTLTSDEEMEFAVEGGAGEITYTLENAVEGVELTAECEAEWVADLAAGEKVTFNVSANKGDARETKVVVAYGDEKFEVAVKQAGVEAPAKVELKANFITGDYYGDSYSPGVGNYYVYLSDLGFDEEGSAYSGGSYYRVDLYGPLYEGERTGFVNLPVGTYTLDVDDTMALWTIGYYYSAYIAFDENGNLISTDQYGDSYDAATLVVTETTATLTATILGVEHIVTFDGGETSIVDQTPEPSQDVELTVDHCYAYYFGDQYNPGVADNFYFFLSPDGLDSDGYEYNAGGEYYRFDIYAEILDSNHTSIPYGTYTIDTTDSCDAGTISYSYSAHYLYDAYGNYELVEYPASGTVTIDENGVVAEVAINGSTHKITFNGVVTIIDQAPEDGGEGGETPGGGNEDGTLSTLTESVVLDIPNAKYMLEYYGDYYENGTENWVLYIYEDPYDFNGAYIMIDLLMDPAVDNIAGTYSCSDDCSMYTFFSGYLEGSEDYYGSWYVDLEYGEMTDKMAPLADGTITISWAEGDIYNIAIVCLDDKGNVIKADIVASPYAEYASTRSAAVKGKPARVSYAPVVKQQIAAKSVSKSTTLSVR